MQDSVLEAIRNGQWDYEPEYISEEQFDQTKALPGSEEKVAILAERAKAGLPLWHSRDRQSYDDSERAYV
ncbi:MAG: hypothetical protein R3C03_01105 [Pirellulaceae bacterium]